jgi:hypothetical protein
MYAVMSKAWQKPPTEGEGFQIILSWATMPCLPIKLS